MTVAIPLTLWTGLYLLLSGSLNVDELVTALAVAVLTTVLTRHLGKDASRAFRWPRSLGRQLLRIPWLLLTGVSRATVATLQAAAAGTAPARALSVELRPGSDEPRDQARRAAAVLIASLAPDTFVVRLDRGRRALLHTIVRHAPRRDPRWLS